jgi:hypothetical protein
MKILHLTLKKKWFDQVASGEKTEEYRENKAYWQTRLTGRRYDEVHFRNGYEPDKPFMRVECLGIGFDKDKNWFVIKLGKMLELKYNKNT